VGEVVAAYGFYLFSAALGASIRFQATTHTRDIEKAELRQRDELARDTHNTIGHHMSGIVIEAQAGRAVAAPTPIVCSPCSNDRARSDPALAEMRTMLVSSAWEPSRTSPRSRPA